MGHLYGLRGGSFNIEYLQAYETVHNRIDKNNNALLFNFVMLNGFATEKSRALEALRKLFLEKLQMLRSYFDGLKESMDLRVEIQETFFDAEVLEESKFLTKWAFYETFPDCVSKLPEILTTLVRARSFVVLDFWNEHVQQCVGRSMEIIEAMVNHSQICPSKEALDSLYGSEQLVLRFVHGEIIDRYNLSYVAKLRVINSNDELYEMDFPNLTKRDLFTQHTHTKMTPDAFQERIYMLYLSSPVEGPQRSGSIIYDWENRKICLKTCCDLVITRYAMLHKYLIDGREPRQLSYYANYFKIHRQVILIKFALKK